MEWLILALAGLFLGGAIVCLRYADPAVRRFPFFLAFLSPGPGTGLADAAQHQSIIRMVAVTGADTVRF